MDIKEYWKCGIHREGTHSIIRSYSHFFTFKEHNLLYREYDTSPAKNTPQYERPLTSVTEK